MDIASFVERSPAHPKRHSRQTSRAIRNASTHQQKQEAVDEYLYCKLHPDRSALHNAEVLHTKLEKLKSSLCLVDAEQVSARGAYYIQHIAGLTKQKKLVSQPQNLAASTALQVERAEETSAAMKLVHAFMEKQLEPTQGPQTRLNLLRAARNTIEAALAFPKRAGWDRDLDAFMQTKACEGPVHGPIHSKLTAKQLNNASPGEIELLADHYFYQKVVATWSAKANSGHIENELQALLPQLQDELLRQSVQGRAQFCMRHMTEICEVKQAQEKASWDASYQASKRIGRTSNDQWRLIMHSADSQHFATVLNSEI